MKFILLCLCFLSMPMHALELKSPKSKKVAEQLSRAINQKMAEIAALEMAAGIKPEDITFKLSHNQSNNSGRFGAVLDKNITGKVILITPNSPAHLIGLKSGDIIRSVNNISLSEPKEHWSSKLQYTKGNKQITLAVKRENKLINLTGKLKSKHTPQWHFYSPSPNEENNALTPILAVSEKLKSELNAKDAVISTNNSSCGRVKSGFYISRTGAKQITDSSSITHINGVPIIKGKTTHRLPVGRHTLTIKHGNFEKLKNQDFALTVKENITYYITYLVNATWEDNSGLFNANEPYTGPIVYKTKKANCKL